MRRFIGLASVAAVALVLAGCNAETATPKAPAQSAATPSTPTAVNARTAEGRAQLEAMIRDLLTQSATQLAPGFRQDSGIPEMITAINLNQSPNNQQVNLVAGADYRIVGVCDAECNNVDVELIDPSGVVAASDVLPDDVPLVAFRPTIAGTYTIRTHLRTCTVEPCYVGTRVLTR
jgi:hypothetical protein